MGALFDQLRAAGGTIYVASLDGDGMAIVTMEPLPEARHAAVSSDVFPIFRHTELQMVIEYLRTQRAPLICREAPQSVLLNLLDDGKETLPVG